MISLSLWNLSRLDFQNPMGIVRPSTKWLSLRQATSQPRLLGLQALLLCLTPSLLCLLWGTHVPINFLFRMYSSETPFVLLSFQGAIKASAFLEKQLQKIAFSPREKHQNTCSPSFLKEAFQFPLASLEAGRDHGLWRQTAPVCVAPSPPGSCGTLGKFLSSRCLRASIGNKLTGTTELVSICCVR